MVRTSPKGNRFISTGQQDNQAEPPLCGMEGKRVFTGKMTSQLHFILAQFMRSGGIECRGIGGGSDSGMLRWFSTADGVRLEVEGIAKMGTRYGKKGKRCCII